MWMLRRKVGIISVGWDPGMFSLNRLYANAILPDGKDYTFWGKGVSQGHSDAIRRVEGVKDGKQYTIPSEAALEAVRNGENPELTTRQKHTRECFVVLEEGADAAKVEAEIKSMPNYFVDYDTTVHFISEEELKQVCDVEYTKDKKLIRQIKEYCKKINFIIISQIRLNLISAFCSV